MTLKELQEKWNLVLTEDGLIHVLIINAANGETQFYPLTEEQKQHCVLVTKEEFELFDKSLYAEDDKEMINILLEWEKR